jgi:TonB family protein
VKRIHIPLALLVLIPLCFQADGQPTDPAATPQVNLEHPSSGIRQEIQLGAPLQTVDPVVPKKLRKKRLLAVMDATLGVDGNFHDVKVLGGDEEFSASALDAVSQWRYTPASVNASPVPVRLFVTMECDKGKVHSAVEPDTLPTQPENEAVERISGQEAFKVDPTRMKPPKPVYTPDPDYSEEARRAKYQGVLVVGMIIGRDGNPKAEWAVKKLGLGLDQKAIEAVRRWKFQPAVKNGEPVAVLINVEVSFRLY